MKENSKTKKELLSELSELRRRIAELEAFRPSRGRTDEDIRRSCADLKEALDAMVPLLIIRKDFTMLQANKTYCDAFKKNEKDFIGKKCFDMWHGSFCNTPGCAMRQILGGKEEYAYEWKEQNPNGTASQYLVRAVPYRDAGGQVAGIIENFTDITELRRTKEDLFKSESKYRLLVENFDGPITVFDLDNRLLLINKTGAENLKGLPGDFIGKSLKELFPERADVLVERNRQVIKSVEGRSFIDEFELPEGKQWFLSNLQPVKDAKGRVFAVQIISSDITTQKRIEEELQKAQKLESIGVLAGGLAHDFNNILAGVLVNIELARKYSKNPEKVLEKLKVLENASTRARNLTEQLLTYAKGGDPIMAVDDIKRSLEESVEFALTGSNVQRVFSIQEDLWPVSFDAGQISQVINNLVINAVQAMPGGGTVRIRAENMVAGAGGVEALPQGKYVKISFQDQGSGIPEAHLPKIFDPFFTTKQKGSGLGLTTSYAIIKKHGGQLRVESKIDRGTICYIYLPASEEKVPKEKDREARYLAPRGRILIMDDDDFLLNSLCEILQEAGYHPARAKKGEDAIKQYREAKGKGRPFDAVLLDLTVQDGLGGRETIRELLDFDPNIKAIVSSGYSTDPVMSNYNKYGFSGCIAKPYTILELMQTIERVRNS
jgi:PAS domain S-box-containing protein